MTGAAFALQGVLRTIGYRWIEPRGRQASEPVNTRFGSAAVLSFGEAAIQLAIWGELFVPLNQLLRYPRRHQITRTII
jgi:hypothetical protein